MIYSQVLWALALDRVVWHISLNVWSIIGVVSVICSLSFVSLAKEVTISRVARGIQYETLPAGANDATPDIDLESLCASEDDDETASDGVLDSR